MAVRSRSGRADAVRRLGPLPGLAVALLLVIAVLPSALNVPQSNPTTTPEFAPVPPQDQKNPPPLAGNLAGVGFSSGLGVSGQPSTAPALLPPGGGPVAAGRSPRAKLCVGNPPRQTEDPLSPPCVAYYKGDNGGATHQGVTATEVRVVAIYAGNTTYSNTSQGSETTPVHGCFDLGKPATGSENVVVRSMRVFQTYFNARYQTYNRTIRIIVCFDNNGTQPSTPELRRAAANQHFATYHPFAFLDLLDNIYSEDYADTMLRHGVMSFSARAFLPASQYDRYAPLSWGYYPSVEQQAAVYSSYVCSKVVNRPVSFSGNGDIGQPRKLGLLYSNDAGYPGLTLFAKAVKKQVEACGGKFADEATYTFPLNCFPDSNHPDEAAQNMASFKGKGITTVIWPGGWEAQNTKAAATLNYYPEWVMAGDNVIEDYGIAQKCENPTEWQHAWVVTGVLRQLSFAQSDQCFLALRDADPTFPEADARSMCDDTYDALRQLFTGVQLAGPDLTPERVDQGFHAIPPIASTDPFVPSCFYEPGDYTCVKDAQAMWWDVTATANNNVKGCWKMAQGGRRYPAGRWPSGDVLAQQDKTHDVCNGYDPSSLG